MADAQLGVAPRPEAEDVGDLHYAFRPTLDEDV